MPLLFFLDLAGTFFFAVSGAMIAVKKKMDLFGVIVLGTVTAIGGIFFLILHSLGVREDIIMLSTTLLVITMRVLAIRYHWKLPSRAKV